MKGGKRQTHHPMIPELIIPAFQYSNRDEVRATAWRAVASAKADARLIWVGAVSDPTL
jgi:hypothetical protein